MLYMFIKNVTISFYITCMHLADAFIQSDLQCIQAIHFLISMCVPWELNPQHFALLTQCSTTQPQEQDLFILIIIIFFYTVYVWKAFCCSMKKPHPVFPLDAVLCCVLAWATSVASASVHLMLLSDLILSLSFPSTGISWPVSIQSMTGSTSSSTPFPCSLCLSPNCLSSTGSVSLELISTDKALIFNTRGCVATYSVGIKKWEI